jgi:hypothetical protein
LSHTGSDTLQFESTLPATPSSKHAVHAPATQSGWLDSHPWSTAVPVALSTQATHVPDAHTGLADEHPRWVGNPCGRHATHAPPPAADASHRAVPAAQPVSRPVPVALSRHTTHTPRSSSHVFAFTWVLQSPSPVHCGGGVHMCPDGSQWLLTQSASATHSTQACPAASHLGVGAWQARASVAVQAPTMQVPASQAFPAPHA